MRIAVRDLPEASAPGKAGVRREEDRIWIPLGVNWTHKYYFPQFATRREHEEERRIARPHQHLNTRTSLIKCGNCGINIGRGFFETELYIYPILIETRSKRARDHFEPKSLCGGCATSPLEMSILARVAPSMDEKHILPVGFCLIGHTDWAGRYGDLIEPHWKDTVDLKVDQLIDDLADPWFKFRRKYEEAYQKYGDGKRLPTPHAIFSQWLPAQQPAEITFTDLYDQLPTITEQRRAA